jgi:hypothetical protein
MSRVLALDYGSARCGCALKLGDTLLGDTLLGDTLLGDALLGDALLAARAAIEEVLQA